MMNTTKMKQDLAASNSEYLDQIWDHTGVTLRQWLDDQIDRLESGDSLTDWDLRVWNDIVPKEHQLIQD